MIKMLDIPEGLAPGRFCGRGHQQSGFTLIEVMIAVLIIAVLAAIAYPSYDNHVTNSRRAAAAGCLMERAQFLERYYTTNMRYVDAGGNAPDIPQCQDLAGHYTVAASTINASSYTLQATPQNRQASKDTRCATLSLTHQGVRGASGTASANPDQCW